MQIAVRRLLAVIEVLAWAAFFALAAAFLALRYWLLPNVEQYRGEIVAAISRSIGLPVTLGALATGWDGLRPRLTISDVRVYDRDGRLALALPAVRNVVSWRSLLVLDLRLRSLVIDRPKLAVRRDKQGAIIVGGLKLAGGGDGALTDWVLSQNEIVIRDAELEWIDEGRDAPPLTLSALNFRLRNDGDEHLAGLSARPPAALGPGLELRAALEGGSVKRPEQWSGRLFAEFGYTDLAGWRAWVDYPLDVRRGEGALRLWATLSAGRITQASADVELQRVTARLAKDLPLLENANVRGRVYGRETGRGYDFGTRGLALAVPGAPPMNGTSFRAVWEPASGSQAQHGSVSANLVELEPLAHLAEFLPFPADLRKLLAELAPQGNLLDVKLDWTGEFPDRAQFSAKTRFAGLSMHAWRSIPGFANLSGSLDANEKKGTLFLTARRTRLELPKVFPEPALQLDALNGEIGWELPAADRVSVRFANLSFANEDFAGTGFGSYVWSGTGPGVIDLTAQLQRADGRDTAKYLPLPDVMGAKTRAWVASAVLGGQSSEARLRLKGDLRDFPFADPTKGQFQVAARVSGATLDYADGWPRIEGVEGEFLLERERIEIVGRSGVILGAKLANVRVSVPSLLDEHPHLLVDGSAEGPTAEFLAYIRQSPVRQMLDGLTDGMTATGHGKLHLRLDLPLGDLSHSKVAGDYQFSGNGVTLDGRLPPVERASGRVSFTESGLTVQDVRGQLLGGAVVFAGGTRADGATQINAKGRATIEGVRALFDHPWRRRLAGATDYTATASAKNGHIQLSFESTLQGVSSALPAPLAKESSEAMPLHIEAIPGEGRDRISVQLGRVAAAEFLRAVPPGAAPGAPLQVQYALITLNPVPGAAPRIPERRGTSVRGSLPALDLDRWLPLLGEGAGGGEGASFDLKIGVLDALGKRMRAVTMLGAAEAGGWSASMSTQEFAGDLSYRSEGGGKLVARFSHFAIPEDSPGAKPGEAARQLPAVDIIAESFTFRDRKLGRVEIAARHEGADWRIDKLAMLNPEASLSGSGLWKTGEGSRTSLKFKLEVYEVGQFLARIGYPDHLQGGRGTLEGSVAWNGDPVTMDYATLGGELQLRAENGQFLEIEPGIGKLVSLMSLQMLPRRVALDFRDVFSKGFQFDRISSALGIERGVMAVKEFRMRGPAADVSMGGQIDLSLETQNLNVKVIPQLGDSASTVIGLVHPAVGVATMIAGRLLKNPVGKIFAYEYAISGTWSDPKVEKLQAAVPVDTPQWIPGG